MDKIKKIFRNLILVTLGLVALFFMYSSYQSHKTSSVITEKPQHWITVFVHGSFGSLMGFLSLPKVVSDDVDGTMYKQINTQMRRNTRFYSSQPMLGKGLKRVIPTLDISATDGRTYAAFPIIKAYETILNEVSLLSGKKETNYFYTFGWSGLISQNRRRREAVRFYNALSEEIEKYHKQGIFPKVRLISHSHGGNLCLNLAAINILLKNKKLSEIEKISKNQDEADSLAAISEILTNMPSQEYALQEKKQKHYEYVPKKASVIIDELIMLAAPIQPETECFIFSDTFKKVYSFYSDQDFAQRVDWVSTKKRFSNQRISSDIYSRCGFDPIKEQNQKIIQAQILVEHDAVDDDYSENRDEEFDEKTTEGGSPWQQLLSGKSLFTRKSKNPSHKEFWFVGWKPENPEFESFLSPLPIVVLTPMIIHAIESNESLNDVDVNIDQTTKHLKVSVYEHEKNLATTKVRLPISLIQEIKTKFEQWRPQNVSKETDFEALSKILREKF